MIPTDIETFAEVKGRNKLFGLPPVEQSYRRNWTESKGYERTGEAEAENASGRRL
jgi:hypothetical protein